jgi:hypothetical protein
VPTLAGSAIFLINFAIGSLVKFNLGFTIIIGIINKILFEKFDLY